MRAEQGPFKVLLNSLHEQIGSPERVEEITSSDLLLSVVLAQIQEVKDISVPRLQVDGKGARTLIATLINITCGVIKHAKHRYEAVGCAIGAGDIGTGGTNAVDVQANAA